MFIERSAHGRKTHFADSRRPEGEVSVGRQPTHGGACHARIGKAVRTISRHHSIESRRANTARKQPKVMNRYLAESSRIHNG